MNWIQRFTIIPQIKDWQSSQVSHAVRLYRLYNKTLACHLPQSEIFQKQLEIENEKLSDFKLDNPILQERS